ncbi:MAG: PilZ domain-containing protein [Planctomycetota bacterium]
MSTMANYTTLSSKVATLPVSLLGETAVLDDRRLSSRALRALAADLVDLRCDKVLCCEAHNVSEGGLFVSTPSDSGLRVGQRFEIRLRETFEDRDRCLVEGCYATVIRTEVMPGEPSARLGAGLRFDQAVYW